MLALLRRPFSGLPLSLLALFFLVLSGGLALLYSQVSLAELQTLRRAIYARNEMPEFVLQTTPARFAVLRGTLLGVALGAAATVALLLYTGRFQREMRELWRQVRAAAGSVSRAVRHTTRTEKLLAALLLLGVLALRLYYFRVYPLSTDEVATYDYFVRGGPVAITSFYPIPNNHILFSLGCWVVSWFTADDTLVLRLPTLLISLVGTALAYALLVRLTTFRVATLALGLFCLSPFCLYYAVAGRGYFLLVALAAGQFFAALAILHAPRYRALGWGLFVITGVLGMYTIPTYAYPLVSLGVVLAGVLLRRRQPAELLTLTVAALSIAAGTGLLYAPVICVSGLGSLTNNQYIAPQTLQEFWQSYLLYLQKPARELFGHERGSGPGFLLVLAGTLALLPRLPRPWRRVVGPALVLVVLPFLFMPLQRVYAPARVLLYGTFFFFVAAAASLEYVLGWRQVPGRVRLLFCAGLLSLYGVYQAAHFRYSVRGAQAQDQQLRQAYAWLRPRQPRQVYFDAPFHKLYFHHFATTSGYPLYLSEASSARAGAAYDYVVVARDQHPTLGPQFPALGYRSVYQDGWVSIYAPDFAPVSKAGVDAGQRAPHAGK